MLPNCNWNFPGRIIGWFSTKIAKTTLTQLKTRSPGWTMNKSLKAYFFQASNPISLKLKEWTLGDSVKIANNLYWIKN